jgi:hypothetical protein
MAEGAEVSGRRALQFGSLAEGNAFELAPGVPGVFLGYHAAAKDVVVSVGGFVLKLNRYDHGQARAWYFIIDGVKYYAQGHHRGTDDTVIEYSVHRADSGDNIVHFGSHGKLEKVASFTKDSIHHHWYGQSGHYKKQVDAILGANAAQPEGQGARAGPWIFFTAGGRIIARPGPPRGAHAPPDGEHEAAQVAPPKPGLVSIDILQPKECFEPYWPPLEGIENK